MPMLRAIFLLQTDGHFRVCLSCFEIIQLHISHDALVSSHVYRGRREGYSVYTVTLCSNRKGNGTLSVALNR